MSPESRYITPDEALSFILGMYVSAVCGEKAKKVLIEGDPESQRWEVKCEISLREVCGECPLRGVSQPDESMRVVAASGPLPWTIYDILGLPGGRRGV